MNMRLDLECPDSVRVLRKDDILRTVIRIAAAS